MGDRSNCSNPTVTSEEQECKGGTSQGKWENAGTKCGNESLEIKKKKPQIEKKRRDIEDFAQKIVVYKEKKWHVACGFFIAWKLYTKKENWTQYWENKWK